MIPIKKVAVTPLPENEAKVIDSFSTTDNKHINAPSLNAVSEYISGNFAELVGTFSVDPLSYKKATFDYPNGFTSENCVPIACGLFENDNKGYNFIGEWKDSASTQASAYHRTLNLKNTEVELKVYNPNTESKVYVTCKIILMKVF